MKKALNIIETILQVILIIVIIFNVTSIISMKILKKGYPDIFGYAYFSVLTGSMEPTIKVGDEVIVKVTKDIKEQDIITYEEDGGFITHRLIRVEGDKLITKGDYNKSEDTPITKDVVIGKVIFTIPFFGKIKYVITDYRFLLVLIVCYVVCEIMFKKK